ncbi:hypothetical protein AB4K20DRAFT_1910521 [Rhizopus microsporus]
MWSRLYNKMKKSAIPQLALSWGVVWFLPNLVIADPIWCTSGIIVSLQAYSLFLSLFFLL